MVNIFFPYIDTKHYNVFSEAGISTGYIQIMHKVWGLKKAMTLFVTINSYINGDSNWGPYLSHKVVDSSNLWPA
jgi:hypothetical protein